MNNVKEQPRIFEPGKSQSCDFAQKEPNKDDFAEKEPAKDTVWLTRFHTIRDYAIRRIIEKEIPILKAAFMRNAKFGDHCTALLQAKDFHRETVTYLHKMGFTFIPGLELNKNDDGSCVYYHACLPFYCEDKVMNAWICDVRKVFLKAQQALVKRHCDYIKQKFEKAAKKRNSTIKIHENYCRNETLKVVEQRYGCEMQKHQQPHYITLTIPDQIQAYGEFQK